MKIFPAIDLYGGRAVRLYKGDYDNMTVYSNNPKDVAQAFLKEGASHLHLVDLEGARDGGVPNLEVIKDIASSVDMFIEVGGGIRSIEVIEKYIDAGVDRVILGTAAVTDRAFLLDALSRFGKAIAVGVDIRDGFVAIKGWRESSGILAFDFLRELDSLGVSCVICTDISKDGAMQGTNRELYKTLARELSLDIVASGGVSSLEDVKALKEEGLYGAIIGKAYYVGAISLKEAIRIAE